MSQGVNRARATGADEGKKKMQNEWDALMNDSIVRGVKVLKGKNGGHWIGYNGKKGESREMS